jgi:hypothetical protein
MTRLYRDGNLVVYSQPGGDVAVKVGDTPELGDGAVVDATALRDALSEYIEENGSREEIRLIDSETGYELLKASIDDWLDLESVVVSDLHVNFPTDSAADGLDVDADKLRDSNE